MTTRATSPESDRDAASVPELTKDCILKFDRCFAPDDNGDNAAMENRLADLRLWADGVGATVEGNASLEWRFRSRPDDLTLVKTILIMLSDFIDDYATLLENHQPIDDAVHRIDSAIENLALIGVAIRRTGKASRRRRADTWFDPAECEDLRLHLECVILLRPRQSGLQDQLDLSSLSIIQKRLIEANLTRRHRFVIAQRRSRRSKQAEGKQKRIASDLSNNESSQGAGPTESRALTTRSTQKGKERAPPTRGGLTAASTAEGTLQYVAGRKFEPGAARTQITVLAAETKFPRPPRYSDDRHIGKCPCCCQSILVEEMTNRDKWRQHIVEDLLPYTCIIEECPVPNLLFSTRKEWEGHVKADHRVQWHCPLCEEHDLVFQAEEEIVNHLEAQHPDDVRDLTLSTLLPWSRTQHTGIASCPLCSSFGREDSPEIVDHILRHVYEFSLRALPWTKPVAHDVVKQVGTYTLPKHEEDADRLVGWIRDAECGPATQLQLSALEAWNHEVDAPVMIDEAGYVPDGEYFDVESVGGSSRRQRATTEPSTDLHTLSILSTQPTHPTLGLQGRLDETEDEDGIPSISSPNLSERSGSVSRRAAEVPPPPPEQRISKKERAKINREGSSWASWTAATREERGGSYDVPDKASNVLGMDRERSSQRRPTRQTRLQEEEDMEISGALDAEESPDKREHRQSRRAPEDDIVMVESGGASNTPLKRAPSKRTSGFAGLFADRPTVFKAVLGERMDGDAELSDADREARRAARRARRVEREATEREEEERRRRRREGEAATASAEKEGEAAERPDDEERHRAREERRRRRREEAADAEAAAAAAAEKEREARREERRQLRREREEAAAAAAAAEDGKTKEQRGREGKEATATAAEEGETAERLDDEDGHRDQEERKARREERRRNQEEQARLEERRRRRMEKAAAAEEADDEDEIPQPRTSWWRKLTGD
ncbi:hypothetical protein BKA56DRAFT_247869 [Ilyonectria sp. MPI-CAGE-AT-0026]|nr:hypothetical protein BKA56DRAFT_247869 [Ilyonectria sp. MPI-CAGE-AT-0026]